ncbi:hypothetical protein Q3G72_032479 [Acer saccharum]|nr:hypothetical protein Q3G72_032479 [Acer saccharum]
MLIARIGNHVEIGADSCIDRGSWRDTVIGDHSKIDNLVQIGHNVIIGKNGMFCGQTGIAGDYVTLGGRVAVRDHVSIASKLFEVDIHSTQTDLSSVNLNASAPLFHSSIRVHMSGVAANSCVTKDIKEPGDYGGFPAVRTCIML